MRLLWSLPKAAPALLRHFVAYAELAGEDLEQTKRDLTSRLAVAIVLIICLFFAVFSACMIVVALTWDTRYRVAAIAWMCGAFSLAAVLCGLRRSKLVRSRAPFLGTVRREWSEDRVILEKILADQD